MKIFKISQTIGKQSKYVRITDEELENPPPPEPTPYDHIKPGVESSDVKENMRFYDPRYRQEGKLVLRKYHQTTLWMMLYDSNEIQEFTNSDSRRIKKI